MIPLPISTLSDPIPPILHQVWVGSEPPKWVRVASERWQEALPSGWRYALHTDDTIIGTMYEPTLRFGMEKSLHPRGVADLLRVQAVAFHGGFYMDTDMVPLGAPLPTDLSGWVMSLPEQQDPNCSVLCNGAFGFSAGHPFLTHVWDHAQRALSRGVRNEHHVAGPRAFRYALNQSSLPVKVDWTLQFWKKKAERRQQARGETMDLTRLRGEAIDQRLIHVGLDEDKVFK